MKQPRTGARERVRAVLAGRPGRAVGSAELAQLAEVEQAMLADVVAGLNDELADDGLWGDWAPQPEPLPIFMELLREFRARFIRDGAPIVVEPAAGHYSLRTAPPGRRRVPEPGLEASRLLDALRIEALERCRLTADERAVLLVVGVRPVAADPLASLVGADLETVVASLQRKLGESGIPIGVVGITTPSGRVFVEADLRVQAPTGQAPPGPDVSRAP